MKPFALALMLMFPAAAFADDTAVTRLHDNTYSVDQTWGGTVIIDGVVQFAAGTTLTIKPGTRVMFTRADTDGDGIGENEIYIQGRLVAKGTLERPIVFTSAEDKPQPGDWGAVNIMVSEGALNELDHCVIEYGYRGFHMHFSKGSIANCRIRDNYLGIQCQDSELAVTGCDISGNRGAIVFKDSKLTLTNNRIADNYWGIRFLYGEATLTGNIITGNMINGVTFRENRVHAYGNILKGNRKGFSAEDADLELKDNIIAGSVESGIYIKRARGVISGNDISGNGDSGISVEDSGVKVTGNNITSNGSYAVDNNGQSDVDAAHNWWGTADPALLGSLVYDKSSDKKLGRVIMAPVSPGPFAIGGPAHKQVTN